MDKLIGAIKSKTMWFNGVITLGTAATWILEHAGLIQAVLPAAAPYIAVVGGINMILRALTTQALEDKVA